MVNDTYELTTTYIKGDSTFGVFTSIPKWINKITKLAEQYPDEVKITYTNDDGTINAELPITYLKMSHPKKMSAEQKEKASLRFQKMWADKKDKQE